MDRRRFLGLVGATTAGLYLVPQGLIELPRRLVIEFAGSCSFCGKHVHEVFGLAGLRHRGPVRICDECIGLCLDIIAEEPVMAPPPPPPRPSPGLSPEMERAMAMLQLSRAEIIAAIETELETMKSAPPKRASRDSLSCSFCEKSQKEVAKLIAGPTVYICDGCIGDASALFLSARL